MYIYASNYHQIMWVIRPLFDIMGILLVVIILFGPMCIMMFLLTNITRSLESTMLSAIQKCQYELDTLKGKCVAQVDAKFRCLYTKTDEVFVIFSTVCTEKVIG
jgi:hypothetical protein